MHVPFCATRCGYCDFNTYIPGERGAGGGGYVGAVARRAGARARGCSATRAARARRSSSAAARRRCCRRASSRAILDAIRERFGLAPGAEVTTEANPESVDPASLAALREAGFTRLSLGMQSAAPHVLATLDRAPHARPRGRRPAREARAAGFEHVSLDLIYGTPGETARRLARVAGRRARAPSPTTSRAYSLIVEPGTRLAAQVRRGELPVPDEDVLADRYETAERVLAAAGLALVRGLPTGRGPTPPAAGTTSATGRGGDWWGVGPGAHSHVGGVRWWNVLHPRALERARWPRARSPAAGRETPDADAAPPGARDARRAPARRAGARRRPAPARRRTASPPTACSSCTTAARC